MAKVLVAMSGGVDSSIAAAVLEKEGYQVIGATLQIKPLDKHTFQDDGCCRIDAVEDAKKVASNLNIPHFVFNVQDIFAQKIVVDFCREYSLGRTPNPCIRCNKYIKFGTLLQKAQELGADLIATGHYAQIEKDKTSGRYLLKKSIDRYKDQSYFLYALTQEQLAHTLLPIGNYTKKQVREKAMALGIPVGDRPESQDICFVPDNDYPDFFKRYVPQAVSPGLILDKHGNTLGKHQGILFYTIGQRKGLGLSSKEPLYVTSIIPENNALVVGGKEDVYGTELIASGMNWISVFKLSQPITAKAKIRYLHEEAKATITPVGKDKIRVRFKEPQMAITPGQAVVFYDGSIVIGGGTIEQKIDSKPL